MHRKPSFAEYTDWLRDNHSVSVDQRMRNHYLIATDAMKRQLCDCSFWQRVTAELPNFDSLYQERTAYDLIVDSNPDVLTKPFDSFLIKTYRRNVNANSNWPEPPDGGWLLPDNWLSRVNDLVRTTIVVKYLDGVGYLIEKFSELS